MLSVANFAVDSNSIAKCVIRTTREPEVTTVLTEGTSQDKQFLVTPYVFIDVSTEPLPIIFLLYNNRWQVCVSRNQMV